MSSIPLPELSIQPPANPLDQYSKIIGLRNLMQQSQYLPQQEQAALAETQARTQGQQTANEAAALQLKIQKATLDAWGDPTLIDEASGKQVAPDSKQPATPTSTAPVSTSTNAVQVPYAPGQQPNASSSTFKPITSPISGVSHPASAFGIDPDALLQGLIGRRVPPNIAVGQVAPFLEYAQKHLTMDTDATDLHLKSLNNVANQLEPIVDETDPAKQVKLIDAFEDHITSSPQSYAGLDPDELNTLKQLSNIDPKMLPLVVGHLGVAKQITEAQKATNDAVVSQVSADRAKAGIKAYDSATPSKVQDLINNEVSPGAPPKGIYAQLASQAYARYTNVLNSTEDVEKADGAIAPIIAEANRVRALPIDAQAQMQARMQEGMALAAPIAKNYTEQVTINGTPYTFADQGNLAKAPNAQYVGATLAEQKIPTVPEKTASSIRGLQADLQNLDPVESILQGKQPTSATSRIVIGPKNTAEKILQIDPQLAALPVFQTAGLKTVRDVVSSGGEGGMRGISPEIVKLGDKIYPQKSDTVATALQKVRNLKSVIGNIVQSTLPNVNPTPASVVKKAPANLPKGWEPAPGSQGAGVNPW